MRPNELTLTTERLILRQWKPSDREDFALINSDPRVMEFLPAVLSRQESDKLCDRIEAGDFAVLPIEAEDPLVALDLRADLQDGASGERRVGVP